MSCHRGINIPFFFVLVESKGGIVISFRYEKPLEMRDAVEETLVVGVRVHSINFIKCGKNTKKLIRPIRVTGISQYNVSENR